MAERPRLKKSDEILGSIAAEPAQTKRAGGYATGKNDGKDSRDHDAKAKSGHDDFFDEDIELTDGPVLPSAQSLAEKLLPKKTARQREFSPYRPPEEARRQASPELPAAPAARPRQPAPAQPRIEFDNNASSGNIPSVEFQAVPAPSAPAAIEFGTDDAPVSQPKQPIPTPQPRQVAPAPSRETPSRDARPARPVQEPAPPTVAEYTFQSFEEPAAAEGTIAEWEFPTQGGEEPRRGQTRRKSEPQEPLPQEARQQQPQQQQPRRERIIQPLRTESKMPPAYEPQPPAYEPQQADARPEPPPPPPPQPTQPPPPPELEISEAERNRNEFLQRIANQFELQFGEKFDDGALKPRENPLRGEPKPRRERPETERKPLFAPEPKPRPEMETPAPPDGQVEGEDFLSYVQRQERERRQRMNGVAEAGVSLQDIPAPMNSDARDEDDEPVFGFIEKFKNDVREEEKQRTEDFKETLSQKFMRERERYLKDLDIAGDEPEQTAGIQEHDPAMTQMTSPRRKLDFQIKPEMHMQPGMLPLVEAQQNPRPSAPPAVGRTPGPVTYTRGGAARPQTDTDSGTDSYAQPNAPGGRKTGEQLLMELGKNTRPSQIPAVQPAKLKFTFETPEDREKKAKGEKESLLPAEKWPRRIVLIAMIAGVFAIGLVVWSMVSYYNLSSRLTGTPENSASASAPMVEDTLDIYNDRVFTKTETVNSVIFKNAGTMLKNAHVKDYVVIDGVEGTDRIRLEDVTVDSAISIKSTGVNTLELHNVKAPRVIVNNPKTGMTVNATGNTDIDVIELRTKSDVKQADIGADFAGFGGMIVTSSEKGGEVEAKLDGLNLRTLQTEAGTTALTFVNNTRVEAASADGSLSLTGDGKISSLSIGAKIGQGAGDTEARGDVVLFVKDVSISSLNVKSPAILNLFTNVDSISTADAISLGGQASVGSLTLNPKIGSSSRLLVDIVSANIQALYSNTQARVNVTGASRVNELTADDSTYALGNKVNHLRVNADGVIYENEPDKITTAKGIKPPQSKADNPNIDFDLGTAQQSVTDVTGEDFATTCGHSRESGGFLLGDGSMDAPYEVSTAMQLAHVGSHLASHFVQTADIDISTESAIASNFPSIGGAGSPFEGVFDGMGFAVSRLKIISQAENIGLFGANKGTIQNVRVNSGEITSAAASTGFVGGIAGFNYDGGQIRSCANGASVTGNQNVRTGGITGGNYGGRIHDCYNYARIAGVDVAGGIVGLNWQGASITGSYNAGVIDGRDETGSVAGKNEDGVIANCYYLERTSGYGIGSGSGTATEKTAEELASPQMAADLSAGNESSLWIAGSPTGSYQYPVHRKP